MIGLSFLCSFFVLCGDGVCWFCPSYVLGVGWLVFWFGVFFCLCLDGESDFFAGKLCLMCWMGSMMVPQIFEVDFF
jgi:hypothetical protein